MFLCLISSLGTVALGPGLRFCSAQQQASFLHLPLSITSVSNPNPNPNSSSLIPTTHRLCSRSAYRRSTCSSLFHPPPEPRTPSLLLPDSSLPFDFSFPTPQASQFRPVTSPLKTLPLLKLRRQPIPTAITISISIYPLQWLLQPRCDPSSSPRCASPSLPALLTRPVALVPARVQARRRRWRRRR